MLHVDAPHFASPTAENVAAAAVAIVKAGGYSHVLAPATGFGKNAMPRIAALLDVAQISEIVVVESPDTFVRPIYAGSVLATVRSSDADQGRHRARDRLRRRRRRPAATPTIVSVAAAARHAACRA